jgi:hypothetical protein
VLLICFEREIWQAEEVELDGMTACGVKTVKWLCENRQSGH